jgi:Major Facilitator Superfamily
MHRAQLSQPPAAGLNPPAQQDFTDPGVKCARKGVEIGAHDGHLHGRRSIGQRRPSAPFLRLLRPHPETHNAPHTPENKTATPQTAPESPAIKPSRSVPPEEPHPNPITGTHTFAWGSGLSSIVSFVMFGLLFAVPLYFQVVRGTNAQGSGVRLLPLIAGLLVGGAVADRLAARAGVRAIAALGFVLLAAGLAVGATTSVATGDVRAIAWIALSGLGLGLVLPTTIGTALGAVSDESSGVSSGVLQALRMAGGAFGAAILGAIINATYRDPARARHLPHPGTSRTRQRRHRHRRRFHHPLQAPPRGRPPRLRERHEPDALGLGRADGNQRHPRARLPPASEHRTALRRSHRGRQGLEPSGGPRGLLRDAEFTQTPSRSRPVDPTPS